MAIIKSYSPFLNLSKFQTFLIDENPNSEYFRITEFKETFTGGKNGFLIEGSEFLKETTEVKIELIDVDGNPIYFEPGNGIPEYYEGTSKLVSVHVYDDTPIGLGKITILGELKNYVNSNGAVVPVPEEWKGVYNVKWERTFKINKNINNEDIVRFYKRPLVNIDEVVKPIFTKTIPNVTQTGLVSGIPQSPVYGTDLSIWRAGTVYKLKTDGNSQWTSSVDENEITVSVNGTDYTSTIIEVLNDREVLVDVPYTSNNIVENFTSQSYSTTFEYVEGQTITDSSLTGSFAKIDITQLKTFVGDVARVKVFRKSRATANDWQFVQESKLESTELLRDITTTSDTELSYGRFDESNLSTYWITSSNDHPTSINVDKLNASVKVDYNTSLSSVQELKTVNTLPISQNVEYTLDFRTLLSGSVDSSKTLRAYLSSSNYQQDILTISGSTQYITREQISKNIIADNTHDAKLVFEFKGDDWYISNVSLKNAQDTSFSPDEFTLIQDIPRKLASETFDFRFEFYDINNNYIPVTVTASKTFNGGNDFPTSGKLLTFESDRNAFRFSTGSIQNPENQVVKFTLTQNNLVGNPTFASAAYDVNGNYLNPSDYTGSGGQYPGFLDPVTPAGGLLTINNFTGSYTGTPPTPFVGSIVYTASLDGLEEFETVYRLEDGENAPTLIVTSDANQFIYEPTTLSPKPSGQSITIRAQRKNLASLTTPITVNSGSNLPPLTEGLTNNGITTYTISAIEFSASFAANNFDEVIYSFTGSDVFGNEQTDDIKLSKVVNFDGVSVILSNEATVFRANSQGVVLDDFTSGDGQVDVRIADKEIQHQNGLTTPNRFDITGSTPINVVEADASYTTDTYGITNLTEDSGSIILHLKYLAGDGVTSQSFNKKVNYTKNRIAAPSIIIDTTNKTQNVDAKSTGAQLSSFEDSTIVVREFYTGSVTTFSAGQVNITFDSNPATIASDNGDLTLSYDNLADGTNSAQVLFTAAVTDSEGVSRSVSDTVSLSKTLDSAPNVEVQVYPPGQTIEANSVGNGTAVPSNLTLVVSEGGVNRTITGIGTITTTGGLTVDTPTAPYTTISFTSTASDMSSDTGTITIPVQTTNSEGTSITKSVTATISRVRKAPPNVQISVSPQSQNISSGSTIYQDPTSIVVSVKEGSTSYGYGAGTTQFSLGTFTGPFQNTDEVITTTLTNVSGSITGSAIASYIDSEGTSDSQTINFSIGVSVQGTDGLPGPTGSQGDTGGTGPGVVFRGKWDSAVAYKFSTDVGDGLGRRDSVMYGSNDYIYATLQNSTNQAPTGTTSDNAYWQFLGSEQMFVAAEIAIFKNSFVKETLNVGLNAEGDEANIAIVGGSTEPYIALGQSTQGYDQDGIFIGTDGTEQKLSLKGGTNYLRWTGNTLEIAGDITVTNPGDFADPNAEANPSTYSFGPSALFPLSTISTPTVSGLYLGSSNMGYYKTAAPAGWKTYMDNNGNFYLNGTAGSLAWVAASDTLSITGSITATSGEFGGITIASNKIYTGTGTWGNTNTGFYADDAGQFSLKDKLTWNGTSLVINGSGTFTGQVTAGSVKLGPLVDGTNNGIYIDSSNYWTDGTPSVRFSVGSTGAVSGGDSYFRIFNAGGIGVGVNGTQAMTFYNTLDQASGMSFKHNGINILPEGAGQLYPGFINFGVGNLKGVVDTTNGNYFEINAVTVSVAGDLEATGNITAFATSDKQLKDNLIPIKNPLNKIKQIGGYEFDWNSKSETRTNKGHDVGVIAQEIQQVLPEVVGKKKDGYLGVKYEKIVPLLIEGIKELTNKVESLENEILKLKGK